MNDKSVKKFIFYLKKNLKQRDSSVINKYFTCTYWMKKCFIGNSNQNRFCLQRLLPIEHDQLQTAHSD